MTTIDRPRLLARLRSLNSAGRRLLRAYAAEESVRFGGSTRRNAYRAFLRGDLTPDIMRARLRRWGAYIPA